MIEIDLSMDMQGLIEKHGDPLVEGIRDGVVVKMMKDTKGMAKKTTGLWLTKWLNIEERTPMKALWAKMCV